MSSLEAIENSERYADHRTPDMILMESESGMPSQDTSVKHNGLTESFFDLLDLASQKPTLWRVLKIKLRAPYMSTREIAKDCGLSQTIVVKYLADAVAAVPALKRIIK